MTLTLEQQVCSLRSAQRLKELGCSQESLFYWVNATDFTKSKLPRTYGDYKPYIVSEKWKENTAGAVVQYSAFTCSEIGEILPATIGDQTWLQWTKSLNGWQGFCESLAYVKWYSGDKRDRIFLKDVHKIHNAPYDKVEPKNFTMAENFALMLIHLIENGLVDLKGDGK